MTQIEKIAFVVGEIAGSLDNSVAKKIFCGICREYPNMTDANVAKYLDQTRQSVTQSVSQHYKSLCDEKYKSLVQKINLELSVEDFILDELHQRRTPFAVMQYFVATRNLGSVKKYTCVAKFAQPEKAALLDFRAVNPDKGIYERELTDTEVRLFKQQIEAYVIVTDNEHGKVWETKKVSLKDEVCVKSKNKANKRG